MRRGWVTPSVRSPPVLLALKSEPIRNLQSSHMVESHLLCVFSVAGTRVLATGGASSNKEILQVSLHTGHLTQESHDP